MPATSLGSLSPRSVGLKPPNGSSESPAIVHPFDNALFEGGKELLRFAAASSKAHAGMVKVRQAYADAVALFQPFAQRKHAQDQTAGSILHAHGLWCRLPESTLQSLDDLIGELNGFDNRLRAPLLSAQLRVPPRRGNRKQALLVAVSQHLHCASFSYEEIAALVPDYDRSVHDKNGSNHKAAVRRVVTRVREPDEREYEACIARPKSEAHRRD